MPGLQIKKRLSANSLLLPPVYPTRASAAQPTSTYFGFDVTRTASVEAYQVLLKQEVGRWRVHTASGRTYDIQRQIDAQPGRYLDAAGQLNRDAVRQLLQQLASTEAITLDQADLRPSTATLQVGLTPYAQGEEALFEPATGPAARHFNARVGQESVQAAMRFAGWMLDIGAVLYGAAELRAALAGVRRLTTLGATRALTASEAGILKKSQATLTAYTVGAMAGGTSYTLFVKDKYFDEAYAAMAAGKPLDTLSAGAKAAMTLLNWTLVPGSLSNNIAQINVTVGKWLMQQTLGKGRLKGLNWGMFIDPRAWDRAHLMRVYGKTGGTKLYQKYVTVLTELANKAKAGQPLVLGNGRLNVSNQAIQRAGFKGLEDLVAAMTADGFWRVFVARPVPGSPFMLAAAGGPAGTANAYLQLALTRGAGGAGANLMLQTLNGLGIHGTVNINWNQTIASALGGGLRGAGAPGAWAATTLLDRIGSYGLSSVAGFLGQWWSKGLLEARGKTRETWPPQQLRAFRHANDGLNATLLLLNWHVRNAVVPDRAIFDGHGGGLGDQYVKRLVDMLNAPAADIVPRARTLDRWLDAPIAAGGLTRRQRLAQVPLPEPLARPLMGDAGFKPLYRTGTLLDLGVVPARFAI